MNIKYNFIHGAKTVFVAIASAVLLVACGGGGSGSPLPASDASGGAGVPTLVAFVGNVANSKSVDGIGAVARFGSTIVTADNQGNLYVADAGNYTIRKITSSGVVTTLAGTAGVRGSADGIGAAARFGYPVGIASDMAGNLYVADRGNITIRKITPAGVVTTFAGTAGVPPGSADGIGAAARFASPGAVATDNAGNVYVADNYNNNIRKITPAGLVSTLAGTAGARGSADGIGVAASFNSPGGIAVDSAGNLYVTDSGNNTIRKITPAGVVNTLAGTAGVRGSADGIGVAASFDSPGGIALDSAGNLYIGDADTIRKITPAGVVTTLAGAAPYSGHTDGIGLAASFGYLQGITADGAGNLYVVDQYNCNIRKITSAAVVSTLAGNAGVSGSVDGIGTAANFNFPSGIAADSAGNLYVSDTGNNTIRKITPAGVVTTLAGTPGVKGSADGTGPAANFNSPGAIASDREDNLYVADRGNFTIRKITPAGVVTTMAGTVGLQGNANGTGVTASFIDPIGIATDSTGNLYVADVQVIGNLHNGIDTSVIRKITPTGVVTTLAGSFGKHRADGTGAAAGFGTLNGITVDSFGNLYVAETNFSTIRKITPAGVATTVVGVLGKSEFLTGPLPAGLLEPEGVAISGTRLYITTRLGIAVVTNLP